MKQVLAALINVANSIKYVQKKGYNDFQKYSYVTEADVINTVRPAMLKEGLMIMPSVQTVEHDDNGNTHVVVNYTVFHESGDSISFTCAGSGNDRNSKGVGDKGIYKALTGANKYALLRLLQLATGDDAEVPNEIDDKKEEKNPPAAFKQALPPPEEPAGDEPTPFVIVKEVPNALADQICTLAEAFLEDCKTIKSLRSFYSINKETWTKLEKMDPERMGLLTKRFTDRSSELKK